MTLYAALLHYPRDRYWMSETEAGTAPDYAAFFTAAKDAGVLRGGEALHPADTAIVLTVDGGKVTKQQRTSWRDRGTTRRFLRNRNR